MCALVKRGKIYYSRFRFGGRETWINTHQTNERKAKIAHEKLELEFAQKKTARVIADGLLEIAKGLAEKQITTPQACGMAASLDALAMRDALEVVKSIIPAPPTTATDLWEKYLQGNPDIKKNTMITKTQRFGRFISWAGSRDIKMFSEMQCRQFLKSLGNVSAQTRNNYISELSSVWAASEELTNPWTERLRERAVSVHKKPFTRDQVRTLLRYCDEKGLRFWHAAIMLAYYTGLRFKDVVLFQRSSLTDEYIDIVPEKTARTGKRVRIPVNAQLHAELDKFSSSEEYFFPQEVAKYQQDRSLILRELRKILIATKLYAPGFGFHSLRHTFVTEALNAGVPLTQVQAVVGHQAVEITEGVYYHGEKHADLTAYPSL